MKNNIVLIGFMGVGKGQTARALAKRLKTFALDCDDLIESAQNCKIREIFERDGEEEFRRIEANLAKFLQNSVKGAVISTGGGFYAVKNLRKIGTIVYLKSSFDKIYERIMKSPNAQRKIAKRPLLRDLDKARELHAKRAKIYARKADIIISVEDKSTQNIVKEIIKKMKEVK